MAIFKEGYGILLDEEEKQLFRAVSNPNFRFLPNLEKLIANDFMPEPERKVIFDWSGTAKSWKLIGKS